MRKIELSSWKDVPRRVDSAKRSLEIIYGVKLTVDPMDVLVNQVCPTEDFLENDKLAFVFREVATKGYDVPIIVVKREDDYFVLDGHHRAFVSKKLCKSTIKANVLKFPEGASYRTIVKRSIDDLPIKEIGNIDDPIVKAWEQIMIILKHYEALYKIHFYLKEKHVGLLELLPTQSVVMKKQVDAIRELSVPILCIEYEDRYYILDGHARSLRAKQLELRSIWAMVLFPETRIDFGIVKTSEEMNLKSLKDIDIID
jgi:hypothetical protein